MRIEEIQRQLEHLYRLVPTPSVQAFLISSEELHQSLPPGSQATPQVLLQENQEDVRLGIHLGEEVLHKLENSESGHLHWPSFFSAAEEVSHFLFLVWSLLNRRPVSLLDLEVQGEIDKFLLASELISNEKTLLNVLFGHADYDPELNAASLARYKEANKLGRKFCRSFLETDSTHRRLESLKQLRKFYRMNSRARRAHIEAL